MTLARGLCVGMAEDEMFAMATHLFNLDALCMSTAMNEWRPGIEQVRAALERLASDIETTKRARVQ